MKQSNMIKTKKLVWVKIKNKYYKDSFTQSIGVSRSNKEYKTKKIVYATEKRLVSGVGFVEFFSKDTVVAPVEEAELFYIEYE